MLRNKKFTYLLFPLVLLLWVIIMYKIFFNSPSDSSPARTNEIKSNQLISKKQINQNYNLKFQNRDPFAIILKTIKKKEVKNMSKVKRSRKIEMKYLGYTKRGNSVLANILFNSNYYILKERDSVGKYLLIEIQEDSILIKSESGVINAIKKEKI